MKVPPPLIPLMLLTAALVGGGATWFSLRSPAEEVSPAPVPPVTNVAAPEPAPPPAVAELQLPAEPANAVAAPASGSRKGALKLPDGTTREALNGVTEDLVMPWPAGYPYSPIVAQETNAGTEWYRHADGSFTTTIVRTETVSGKVMQIPLCYTPKQGAVTPVMRQQ